jgi:hypothetical protein
MGTPNAPPVSESFAPRKRIFAIVLFWGRCEGIAVLAGSIDVFHAFIVDDFPALVKGNYVYNSH